jgi:hypothetical protein
MKKLKKRSRKKMLLLMSREKLNFFMLMRSTPPSHPHGNPNLSDSPESGLEGQNQLQGQDRFSEGKEKRKSEAC